MFEMTNTMKSCMNLFKEEEEQQVEEELVKKNFIRGKRKNCWGDVKGISEHRCYIQN